MKAGILATLLLLACSAPTWAEDDLGLQCMSTIGVKFKGIGYEPKKIPKFCQYSETSEINNKYEAVIDGKKYVGGCTFTYYYINDQVQQLQNGGIDSCKSIESASKGAVGSLFFNKDAEKIRNTAKENLSKFQQQLILAKEQTNKRITNNLNFAQAEIDALKTNGNTAEASELQSYLDQAKKRSSISSRKEADSLNEPLLKRKDPAITMRAAEQILATNEGVRFRSLVEEQEKEVQAALLKLETTAPTPPPGKQKGELDTLVDNSGLGSAVSGLLPLAPIAVPIITSMMNQSKSGVGSTTPNGPTLPKAPEQVAGSKLSQGETSAKSSDLESSSSEKSSIKSSSQTLYLPSGSGEDNIDPLLSDVGKGDTETNLPAFQGSLGKGQDLGLGKGMESGGSSGGSAEGNAAATAGGGAGEGGIPMPRGTASTSGSQLSSLLKQLDENGSTGATGNTEPALSGALGDDLLKQMEALDLPAENSHSGENPQIHATSLFSRVRATHIRFIKRGGVTSEAGGKVL